MEELSDAIYAALAQYSGQGPLELDIKEAMAWRVRALALEAGHREAQKLVQSLLSQREALRALASANKP